MFTQIFHLADIHIRKGNYLDSRYTEYLDVINNTIQSFQKLQKKDESICVLCGDIFHHKLQISSHGIVLFYKLVYAIADMMPIVIIQGNHDLIQENNDENSQLLSNCLKIELFNYMNSEITSDYMNSCQSKQFHLNVYEFP